MLPVLLQVHFWYVLRLTIQATPYCTVPKSLARPAAVLPTRMIGTSLLSLHVNVLGATVPQRPIMLERL